MTATEASRNFAAVITAVEHGEEIVVTRDGRPVARLSPERRTVADRVREALANNPTDPDFGDELEATRQQLRSFLVETPRQWPAD